MNLSESTLSLACVLLALRIQSTIYGVHGVYILCLLIVLSGKAWGEILGDPNRGIYTYKVIWTLVKSQQTILGKTLSLDVIN